MARVNNFSTTQQVLNTDDWEALRIIDEKSQTTQLVASKLREIVQRLLSGATGQYNIDDFEFLVSAVEDRNAFFINRSQTKNGKHVIGVTVEMIYMCQTEDELAAVIGHELGHFTYNQVFGNANNTVYQERGADLHSVDLLIDGGYNPRAYQTVAKRLFRRPVSNMITNVLSSLGVHGGNFSRVEDIEAYMTYLKKERGELDAPANTDNSDWEQFLTQFTTLLNNDGYKSYIDQKWGSQIITQQNLARFLEFVARGLESGELDSEPRRMDVANKLNKFVQKNKDVKIELTDAMRKNIETAAGHTATLPDNDAKVTLLRALHSIYGRPLPLVGIFAEFATDLQKFIDTRNNNEMTAIAQKWGPRLDALRTYSDFGTMFETMPMFVMPPQAKAVGQTLPYAQHLQNPAIKDFMEAVFGLPKPVNEVATFSGLTWPDDKPYPFQADKGWVIIRVGAEVTKSLAQTAHNDFAAQLELMTNLFNVYRGTMKADDFWAKYPDEEKTIDKILYYRYDLSVKSEYWDADAKMAAESDVYKAMAPAKVFGSSYRLLDEAFAPMQDSVLFDNVINMLMTLIDKTTTKDRVVLLIHMYAKFKRTRYHGLDGIKQATDRYMRLCQKRYTQYIEPEKFFDYFVNFNLDKTIDTQLRKGEPTPELDLVFDRLNVAPPKNAADFEQRVRDIYEKSGLFATHFPQYWFIRCMQQDLPVVDDMLYFFQGDQPQDQPAPSRIAQLRKLQWRHLTRSVSYMVGRGPNKSPALTAEFAKYVRRHNLFPRDDFERAFEIYRRMDVRRWFSKDETNQSEYLWILIDGIKKLPVEKQEEFAFRLLCGAYDTNEYDEILLHRSEDKTITSFPNQEMELMKIYVDAIYSWLGKDDGTYNYPVRLRHAMQKIEAIDNMGNNINTALFSPVQKAKLYRMLSDKIVSQQKASQMLNTNATVADADIQRADDYGRGAEGFLAFLEDHSDIARNTIEFLNRRLTQDSVNAYKAQLLSVADGWSKVDEWTTTELLEFFYNSFWNEGLAFRSVVMNKLLNRVSNNPYESARAHEQIMYVCDMHFPKDSPYRKDAELIFETAIMSFEPFERGLILAAIASADENKDEQHQNAAKSVGAGLRMFFENMGPAWVKFGQLLSYVPELPSEIRHDLGKLKDKADIPARWELFESIKSTLPDEVQKNIVHVDEILGAGSFWVTAKVQYVDVQSGTTQSKVLSLLRPNALKKSRSGFEVIEKTILKLAQEDEKYKPLLKVAHQAKVSAEFEVDVVYGNKQFERAKRLYGDMSVTIDGTEYKPNVADWQYYGVGKDEVGYKLMDLARGQTLDKVEADTDARRKMALAYVTLELTNLFKGDVWDIDRHMGQQNFEVLPNGNVNINIYDTGAQMQRAPDATDKMLLADVLYDLMRAARLGMPLDLQIMETIKKLDTWEAKYKINTQYVGNVQKGLMALSDVIEYQKEIKDKDGNVIQERLSLSAADLANAVEAAYASPSTDAVIKMSLAGKILLNKLQPWRAGWKESLNEGIRTSKKPKNPVRVNITHGEIETNSVHLDKPATEIEAIESGEADQKILGINKKYIRKSKSPSVAEVAEQLYARAS